MLNFNQRWFEAYGNTITNTTDRTAVQEVIDFTSELTGLVTGDGETIQIHNFDISMELYSQNTAFTAFLYLVKTDGSISTVSNNSANVIQDAFDAAISDDFAVLPLSGMLRSKLFPDATTKHHTTKRFAISKKVKQIIKNSINNTGSAYTVAMIAIVYTDQTSGSVSIKTGVDLEYSVTIKPLEL
jgi:hypothetical protein